MARTLLNRPLELQARGAGSDGAGGRSGGWVTLGTLWGEVSSGRGRERGDNEARTGRTPVVVRVRAAPIGAPERPVAGQRFLSGARAFRILAVAENDASGRLLRCICEEEVAS